MAILKIKDKGVWKEIQAIKGDTGHDVYVGDKSKAPSEAKLIIEPVKGTATGTDIQVTDSANDRVSKLVLDGKSTQETRSGKNILNFDAVLKYWNAIYTSSDNVYSLTDTSSMYKNPYVLDLEVGKNYTFSIQGATQNSTNLKLEILKDGTVIQFISAINGDSKTFEVESGATYTLRGNYATREYPVIFNKPMLRLSTTDDTYEPYGVMPSPDYPSEIENVKGKNLLPNNATSQTKNGVTFTVNNDKTILVNGTSTAVTDLYMVGAANEYVDLGVPTGNYIISGCPVGGNASTYMLYAVQKRGDKLSYYQEIGNGLTINVEAGDTFRIFIRILSGKEVANALYKPMLSKNGGNYVPYGNIQIVETGKNLFDKDNEQWTSAYISSSSATKLNPSTYTRTLYIKCLPNTTYTIQKMVSITTSRFFIASSVDVPNIDVNIYNVLNAGDTSTSATYTTSNNAKYLLVTYMQTNSTSTTVEEMLDSIQIEKGSTATPYESYTEEVANIDLKGNELCSLPNGTKDELIVKDGRAKIVKRIGKVVLNGSNDENWGVYSEKDDYFFYSNNILKTTNEYVDGFCSHFINSKTYPQKAGYFAFRNKGNGIYFRINGTNTVADWRTWLSTHNTIVQYELEEPYEIDLGEVSMLTTYEGTSNIANSEDAEMSIEYDTNKTNLYYQNNGNIIKMNEGS